MNLKRTLLSLALLVLAIAGAQASTIVTFSPATGTTTSGFQTSNPAYVIDFITPNYNNNTTIVSVNGVVYRGPSAWVADGANGTHQLLHEANVILTAANGTFIVVSLNQEHWTTAVNSGRAHYYLQHNVVTGGAITFP